MFSRAGLATTLVLPAFMFFSALQSACSGASDGTLAEGASGTPKASSLQAQSDGFRYGFTGFRSGRGYGYGGYDTCGEYGYDDDGSGAGEYGYGDCGSWY